MDKPMLLYVCILTDPVFVMEKACFDISVTLEHKQVYL